MARRRSTDQAAKRGGGGEKVWTVETLEMGGGGASAPSRFEEPMEAPGAGPASPAIAPGPPRPDWPAPKYRDESPTARRGISDNDATTPAGNSFYEVYVTFCKRSGRECGDDDEVDVGTQPTTVSRKVFIILCDQSYPLDYLDLLIRKGNDEQKAALASAIEEEVRRYPGRLRQLLGWRRGESSWTRRIHFAEYFPDLAERLHAELGKPFDIEGLREYLRQKEEDKLGSSFWR